ncbi:MAG: hypothetical protein EOO09_00825 [Chitinophagaceae bacterium]|nr:MAG: hypothetical protein EOO09_00825 [Chitinophagaceae bacterium]
MKSLWIIPGVLLAMACNNPGDKINSTGTDSVANTGENIPPVIAAADTGLAGCYGFEGGRDTIILQLERKGDNVTGPLSYNYFEKDRNDGTLQGVVSGELLTGFYLFKSEGVMSVRQEIFKLVNGNLVPGYGEVIQRNDSTLFKNPAALKFDESRALKKRNCTT